MASSRSVALEDVEAGDPLLRLGERAVGDQHLALAHPDGGGVADRSQALAGHPLAAAVDVVHPLLDGQISPS